MAGNRPVFITTYRAEDAEKLSLRMKHGFLSSKYKPAEYEKLQAMVEAKRQKSELTAHKVQRILFAAKATRASSVLRQQRQVWSTEYTSLAMAEEKAEDDLCSFIWHLMPSNTADTGIFSIQDYGLTLDREREAFREATVEPVLQLSGDLRLRLHGRHQALPQSPNWEHVQQQVNSVKDQQQDIIEKLHAERLCLEEMISALDLKDYSTSMPGNLADIGPPLPPEVLHCDCPYPHLKESLIQAFQSLSERYQRRLQGLRDHLQGIDERHGWCTDDHLLFQQTVGGYPRDTPNRRALCMDMLQRLFPQRTRKELIEHESFCDWQHFTQAQLRAAALSWQRDRAELLARALVTMEEASQAYQEELELHRDRQHQQDICSRLRDKLQQWRARQEEVARLEATIAARRQEEDEERMKKEKVKEAAVRSHQKEKVRQFYFKKQRTQDEREKRDQDRLRQLRRLLAEQAERDKERVQFREETLRRRNEEKEARQQERRRDEEDRQNCLEALRNQVAVVAEADPARMMGCTEAWRGRQKNEEEFVLQRPLYNINTYTDTQIVSDPRVRVEQALREAGLHHTQYAREVISSMKPHKPPRRDTESVIFKS